MSDKPRRKVEIGIRIGADSWEDALANLNHIAFQLASGIDKGQRHFDSTMGGPNAGHVFVGDEDATWDHDRYFAEIGQWLEAHRHPDRQRTDEGRVRPEC